MTLKNPPLVEIIAEVRWGAGSTSSQPSIVIGPPDAEESDKKFGQFVAKAGYLQQERLRPEGFPISAGTIVRRYRRIDDQSNTLYQMGPGVFTANGLPPYDDWTEFRSVLLVGLEALWAANYFSPSEPIEVILRYVDAFSAQHMGGATVEEFFREVIGVNYSPVSPLDATTSLGGARDLRFLVTHQSTDGDALTIDVGQGYKDREEIILMNTLLRSAKFEGSDVSVAIAKFDQHQSALHNLFFAMIDRSPRVDAGVRGRGKSHAE